MRGGHQRLGISQTGCCCRQEEHHEAPTARALHHPRAHLRMSDTMCRIISLSCSMCAPSAYSVPSASNVMSLSDCADACTCSRGGGAGGRRPRCPQTGSAAAGLRAPTPGAQGLSAAKCTCTYGRPRWRPSARLRAGLSPPQHAGHCTLTCAMLKMWRSSAKLGGTYWRRDSAKKSSYSWKASTILQGWVDRGAANVGAGADGGGTNNRCASSEQVAAQARRASGAPAAVKGGFAAGSCLARPAASLLHCSDRPTRRRHPPPLQPHAAAGAHLRGTKKEPIVGTMRRRREVRGSARCSAIQRSIFCITCLQAPMACAAKE